MVCKSMLFCFIDGIVDFTQKDLTNNGDQFGQQRKNSTDSLIECERGMTVHPIFTKYKATNSSFDTFLKFNSCIWHTTTKRDLQRKSDDKRNLHLELSFALINGIICCC